MKKGKLGDAGQQHIDMVRSFAFVKNRPMALNSTRFQAVGEPLKLISAQPG